MGGLSPSQKGFILKKLAIVGAQELTRDNAPFDNKDYEIWTISNWANADWCKRVDAVIEIHTPDVYKNHPLDSEYWSWLQKTKKTIYMLDLHPSISNAKQYPLDKVSELSLSVHGNPTNNFGSSVDYALALAIQLGYKEVEVYGVEMAESSEYKNQQSSFAFWVGVAAGRGISIDLKCTDKLFNKPLYGRFPDTTKKLHEYTSGLKSQKLENTKQGHMLDGALQILNQLIEDE